MTGVFVSAEGRVSDRELAGIAVPPPGFWIGGLMFNGRPIFLADTYGLECRTSTFPITPDNARANDLRANDAHYHLEEIASDRRAIRLDLKIEDSPHPFAPHRTLRRLMALYAVPVPP